MMEGLKSGKGTEKKCTFCFSPFYLFIFTSHIVWKIHNFAFVFSSPPLFQFYLSYHLYIVACAGAGATVIAMVSVKAGVY